MSGDDEAPGAAAGHAARSGRRRESATTRALRRVLAPLVAGLLRLLARTWRIEFRGPDPFDRPPPVAGVGVVWHRNILAAAGVFRDSGFHVPVSASRDGEHIVAVMAHLGLGEPPRGSSSRGAVGLLKSMMRLVAQGRIVVVFADGPRGPARVAKSGPVAVALHTGCPIVPVALAARPCLRFGSWDRILLPLPFARVLCQYGDDVVLGTIADGARQEAARGLVEARLNAMTDALDAELGLTADVPPRGDGALRRRASGGR